MKSGNTNTKNILDIPIFARATKINEYQEIHRIYDPNHLGAEFGIEYGDVEAYIVLSSYAEEEINELMSLFKNCESLVKFYVLNPDPEHLEIIIASIEQIDWEKPISSYTAILDKYYLSFAGLWDQLSYGYLDALASALNANGAGGNLHQSIRRSLKHGPTQPQLGWFVDILLSKHKEGSVLFTGGELATFSSDVELINRYCKSHQLEL